MRMEIVLTKEEVQEALRSTVEESDVTLAKADDGSFRVSVESETISEADLADAVCSYNDVSIDGMDVESVTVMPEGGLGLVLRKK